MDLNEVLYEIVRVTVVPLARTSPVMCTYPPVAEYVTSQLDCLFVSMGGFEPLYTNSSLILRSSAMSSGEAALQYVK